MRCSEELISAISVVDTVMHIAYIIFGGLSSAVSILIGNRLGANQIEEAKSNAYKLITFGVMIGISIGTISVSYTHLDVYKRQILCHDHYQ